MIHFIIQKTLLITLVTIAFSVSSCKDFWSVPKQPEIFKIPVAKISVKSVINTNQWKEVPYLFQAKKENSVSDANFISAVKVATDPDRYKLFFLIEANENFNNTHYYITAANSYSCEGYNIHNYLKKGSASKRYTICMNSPEDSKGLTITSEPVRAFELSIDMKEIGILLNDEILLSVFSAKGPPPPPGNYPIYSTTRWARLR